MLNWLGQLFVGAHLRSPPALVRNPENQSVPHCPALYLRVSFTLLCRIASQLTPMRRRTEMKRTRLNTLDELVRPRFTLLYFTLLTLDESTRRVHGASTVGRCATLIPASPEYQAAPTYMPPYAPQNMPNSTKISGETPRPCPSLPPPHYGRPLDRWLAACSAGFHHSLLRQGGLGC